MNRPARTFPGPLLPHLVILIILIPALLYLSAGCITENEPDPEAGQPISKPRVVVTTDGEIDDIDSFIRFLLYTNEFDIEALVYSSSQWHYAGDGQGTLFTSEMERTARSSICLFSF